MDLSFFGIAVSNLDSQSFITSIKRSIDNNRKLNVAYANTHTLNIVYKDQYLKNIYNTFDLVHPDGVGIYLASKFLYGKQGFNEKLTGSDFYITLISHSIRNKWSYFFFGHNKSVLENIKNAYPTLNIAGTQEGYNYKDTEVVNYINEVNPDIIIIGLSCPLQERWMYENKEKINYKVLLAVGDGIRVFADKKIRGPVFLRRIGLEWFVRYLKNPVSDFNRYIIGNFIFIYRVCKEKLTMRQKI